MFKYIQNPLLYMQTLLNEMTLEETAIQFLKDNEPEEGYILAFSGGKDSMVIYDLAKKSGVKFHAYYANTTIDPPEIWDFINKYYPEIEKKSPKRSMFSSIVKHGTPPTRMIRFCCDELKEIHGWGHTIILGVRACESAARRNRSTFYESYKHKGTFFCCPIYHWLDLDVWEYIKSNNMPYCKLYDEGFKRIGCVMCPLNSEGMIREAKRYPRVYKQYLRTFDKMLKKRKKPFNCAKTQTPEGVMQWWLHLSDDKFQALHNEIMETKSEVDNRFEFE